MANAIGVVSQIQGTVSVTDTYGGTRELSSGSPIFEGDVVASLDKSSSVHITFENGNKISLGGNESSVIDKTIYKLDLFDDEDGTLDLDSISNLVADAKEDVLAETDEDVIDSQIGTDTIDDRLDIQDDGITSDSVSRHYDTDSTSQKDACENSFSPSINTSDPRIQAALEPIPIESLIETPTEVPENGNENHDDDGNKQSGKSGEDTSGEITHTWDFNRFAEGLENNGIYVKTDSLSLGDILDIDDTLDLKNMHIESTDTSSDSTITLDSSWEVNSNENNASGFDKYTNEGYNLTVDEDISVTISVDDDISVAIDPTTALILES